MLKSLVDAMDVVAMVLAAVAIVFLFVVLPTASTQPEFMQLGLFSLMLAIVPYCIAGALHRIYIRR